MGTQRIVKLVAVLALVVGAVIFLRNKSDNSKTIRVCTWSNYFPEASLAAFTAKTGIKVELSYISSNEELFSKLKAGATGFDIIQPSDYMIGQLNKLNMLTPLDQSSLTNLSHLDDYYRTLPYDPGFKHSVPFTWGTTGIAVNSEKVKVTEAEVSWKLLLDTQAKHTSLLDDMREVFSAVLFLKGLDPNQRDAKVLEAASKDVAQAKSKVLMFTSEPKPLLLRGELDIAHIYSVDAIQAGKENPNIKYFIPKEGAIIWTDNFAIPKTSNKVAEAHSFINHFLDPDAAYVVITENNLATPNKTARAKLPDDIKNDPAMYPPQEVLGRLKFLVDIGDGLNSMNRLWTELKS